MTVVKAYSLRTSRRTFTLIELIIVIVVLGILSTIAIVGYRAVVDKSTEAKQVSRMTQVLKEAKVLYVQNIYSDPSYTWTQAVATAIDDLPTYTTNALSYGAQAQGASNENTATNGWTAQIDVLSTDAIYSASPNDIVMYTTPSGTVYVASAISSSKGVFGMVSQTMAPFVWVAGCSGNTCDAVSASAGPPAGGSYSAGTTTAPTTSTTSTTVWQTNLNTPTITSVTAGNLSLFVSFTADTSNGGPNANYQYSIDNGSTWTTRSPQSDNSPLEITGLTNGVTYQVKLRAINHNGVSGTASNAVAGTPTWSGIVASCSGCSSTTVVSGGRTWRQYTFLGNGTMTVSSVGTDASLEYLVVGGGAGGALYYDGSGGAGGSGGQVFQGSLSATPGMFVTTVGWGGGGGGPYPGQDGGWSGLETPQVFDSVWANGGCGGIHSGCGMWYDTAYTLYHEGGTNGPRESGGGGAGAGGSGSQGDGDTGGNGGAALAVWGSSYGGGGGGGGGYNGLTSSGGSGAGSGRGYMDGGQGGDALDNRGGGGGGGYVSSGNGGSGIVIIRYPITAP